MICAPLPRAGEGAEGGRGRSWRISTVESLIHDAIEMHLAGMREDGDAILLPSSQVEYIDEAAHLEKLKKN